MLANLLKKKLFRESGLQWPYYDPFKRNEIPAEVIYRAQHYWASDNYCKKIWKLFYRDFRRKPFISKDRELYTIWLQVMTDPQSIIKYKPVEKKMMIVDQNGLLPGHIKMLEWLQYPRKKVPVYFEYQYGINFFEEKVFLKKKGYIDLDDNVTDEGMKIIPEKEDSQAEINSEPISTSIFLFKEHGFSLSDEYYVGHSTGKVTGAQYRISQTNLINIQDDIDIFNVLLARNNVVSMLQEYLSIDAKKFCFKAGDNESYLESAIIRNDAKRATKRTFCVQYEYFFSGNNLTPNRGWIYYSSSGRVTGAELIFWTQKNGYQIKFRSRGDMMYISEIEQLDSPNKNIVYKF